jgi:probable F420-dependent oxidoreductase
MPVPEFGVIYSRLHEVVAPASFARKAEALGYDAVWVTEGLASQLAALDPILVMAELARATRRLRVGSCVILSPLRNPAVLAKQVATLDFLSEGRITLGVAVGGSALSNPADYSVSGVDQRERGARCDEGIVVMKKLWTGERVSHHGRFFSFDDVYMHPRPVQSPHPPLWIGGNAEGAVRRAARFGDGFVPVGQGETAYSELRRRLAAHAAEAGRDPAAIAPAVHLYYCMAASRPEACALVERTLTARYGFAVSIEDDGRYLLGDADDCAKVIESYLAAGVAHFVVNTVRPLDEVERDIARFATEVMPRFR